MTVCGSPSPITCAVVQHDQPPTDAHDLFEIVLDQNHGNALGVDRADDLDLSSGFHVVEPGERLVQQDHAADRRRARAPLRAASAGRAATRRRACARCPRGRPGEGSRQRVRVSARRSNCNMARKRIGGAPITGRQHDIVERGHLAERPHDLVRQGQPLAHARRRWQSRVTSCRRARWCPGPPAARRRRYG